MPDPIRNRPIGPGQPYVGDVGKTDPPTPVAPKAPQKEFEVGAVSQPPAREVEARVMQNYGAVSSRIQDGLKRGLDRGQILQELARHELSDLFGGKVTDAAVKYVSDAVANNPNLSQMFGQLFKLASAEQNR